MPLNRYFKLYLNAGRSIPLVINANQNDSGEQWYFSLFTETGEQYYPSAGAIVGIKCDGKLIDNEATVDSRGYVIVTETAQMTAVPGKNIFELQLNEHTHGTANFIVLVEPSPTNGGVLSDSDLSLFQQAINSIAIAGSGAPAVATAALEMTDTGKIYLYAGSETGYTAGDWYYYNGSAWVDGGKYGGTVDATLTKSGQAADAKKTGDEISDLKSEINKGGLTDDFKNALYELVSHINGWDDNNSQTYIANLYSAMNPTAVLESITAVYTPSGTVYVTDTLDDLKADLVVTAHYSDETSKAVTTYTLSGELTNGTNEITVSYGGKTTTFTVTATRYKLYDYIYPTSNGTDYVDTGLIHNPSWTTLNIEFEALNNNPLSSSDGLIGACNTNTSDTSNLIWYARASKGGFSTYSLGVAKKLDMVPANTRAICKYFFVDGGESYLMYNDTRVAVATVSSNAITPNNKTLLLAGTYAIASGGSPYGMGNDKECKLGYVKFSNPSNNEVLYNFIPAQDLSSGKYGFYETVGNVFYPQIGTELRCANWE